MLENIKSIIIENQLQRVRKKLSTSSIGQLHKDVNKLDWKIIEKIKAHNLVKNLKHSAKNSPYYKDKISEIVKGITTKNAYDKVKLLPFTTSSELSQKNDLFLAIPLEEVNGIHFTYGTTGGKKTVYNSKMDIGVIDYSYKVGFVACDLVEKDIAQIMYSFGIWAVASYIHKALTNSGIISLPIGNYVSYEDQQYYIEKFNTNVLFGTPSYVYNLSQEIDLKQENKEQMKAILLGGEGLPIKRRNKIESELGGEVFLNYGLNEFGGGIGSECKQHNGYHIHTNAYCEIIDPKTEEPIEKEEWGELVLTSLTREAMPLIRYKTGDITRLLEGECECGLQLPRLDYLKGRADDRVIIGAAEKYYPIVFDQLLDSINEIKDYWIEITREKHKDSLNIFVVTRKPSKKLEEKITNRILSNDALRVDITTTKTVNKPKITFMDKLPNNNIKRRRLVDKRKYKR